jgi:hypothetical protein
MNPAERCASNNFSAFALIAISASALDFICASSRSRLDLASLSSGSVPFFINVVAFFSTLAEDFAFAAISAALSFCTIFGAMLISKVEISDFIRLIFY